MVKESYNMSMEIFMSEIGRTGKNMEMDYGSIKKEIASMEHGRTIKLMDMES
jgi:hypothetical protein